MNNQLLKVIDDILIEAGFESGETLYSLLDEWSDFIEECSGYYRWDYYEYMNELQVRGKIEVILINQKVSNFDEVDNFKEQVDILD